MEKNPNILYFVFFIFEKKLFHFPTQYGIIRHNNEQLWESLYKIHFESMRCEDEFQGQAGQKINESRKEA